MNSELISKLSQEAITLVPAGLDSVKWIEVYNEKLAFLLVKECIEVADRACASTNAYHAIKNHFEIEL